MKVQRILFKNIHSLKGVYEIDFEKPPLSETGIFAIVGPTGSGKSTLLDVIMLALYGQIPRMNSKITKKEVAEMGSVLTRNTNEALAIVEYSAKGKRYRSKWTISKAKTGNFRDYDMELAELPDEKIIEDKKSNVPKRNEEIIGLNYEQFLKSIVLSQGEFSKFLKADENERAEMLEKITGTEIYREIGKKAFEISKQYKNELENKKLLLDSILNELLSDEQRKELNQQLVSNNDEIIKFKKNREQIEASLNLKNKINELNKKLLEIQKQIKQNEQEILEFSDNDKRLSLYEKLIAFKSDIKEVEIQKKQISENKNRILTIQTNLSELNEKLQILEQNLLEKNSKLNSLQQKNLNLKEIYEQADELETQLKIKNENLKQSSENLTKAKAEKQKIEKQKQEFEQNHNLLNQKLQNKLQWLEKHKDFTNISLDLKLIINRLNIYNDSKSIATNAISESKYSDRFKNLQWKDYSTKVSDFLKKINQQIAEYETKVSTKDKESLKAEIDIKQKNQNAAEKLILMNRNYADLTAEIEKFKSSLSKIEAQKAEKEKILQKTQNEAEIVSKKVEELQKKLEREKLEAKYKQDRLNLKSNMPCPLCGSLEHPYVKHKKEFYVSATEQELLATKKLLEDLKNQVSNYQVEIAQYSEKLTNTQELYKTQTEKYQKQSAEIYELCNEHNFEFDCFDDEAVKEFFTKNKSSLIDSQNRLKIIDLLQDLYSQKLEFENISEKLQTVSENHKQLGEVINPYKQLWQNKGNLNQIIKYLEQFAKEFEKNKTQIEDLKSETKSISEALKQIDLQFEEKQSKVQEYRQQFEKAQQSVNQLYTELKKIESDYFEGQSRTVFKQKLENEIDNLRKIQTDLSNRKSSLKTSIEEKNKFLTELKEKNEKFNNDYTQNYKILTEKLQNIGIESVEKASMYMLEDSEYEQLRKIKKQLEQNKNILTNQKQNVEAELLEQKAIDKDERNYDDLLELKNFYDNKIEEFNKQIGSINQKLSKDKELKANSEIQIKELEKLQKQADRWERLNKLIGDREGNKFSKIAQQFTLSYLINFANKHLSDFTDRYILFKSQGSKNNLFVYDRNMGMEKRSVQTLSGGETFLVSLSLALALSDLASRNTRIESLFIDEGFATLDEDTLDRALVNLEKLHENTKRTIGIISHVQLIKERISTKIVLEKTNTGFSNIVII